MSVYQKLTKIGLKFVSKSTLLKYGFNYSPMYRRSTGKIIEVSDDIHYIKIKIPYSWKNRNYANSIFGGSLFSSVDPIYMVQLINILGDEFVVWDKAATIQFKKPAKENVYTTFVYTKQEIEVIKERVLNENEIEIVKRNAITSNDEQTTYCIIDKTIYIAQKKYYQEKIAARKKRVKN